MLPEDDEIHESFFDPRLSPLAPIAVLTELAALPIPFCRRRNGVFYSPANLRSLKRSAPAVDQTTSVYSPPPPGGPLTSIIAPASPEPPGPEVSPSPAEPAIPNTAWLRSRIGQVEQRVLLCNLPTLHARYEGLYGWALLSHFLPSAESLVPVLLDSGHTIQVNSKFLYMCNAQDHARTVPGQQLLIVSLHLRFDNHRTIPVRALIDTGCQLDGAVNEQLLQSWGVLPRPSTTTIHGATGSATGVPHILANVVFGSKVEHRLDMVVLPLPGVDILLGNAFLQSVGAMISYRDRTVSWRTPKGAEVSLCASPGPDHLPFFRGHSPQIPTPSVLPPVLGDDDILPPVLGDDDIPQVEWSSHAVQEGELQIVQLSVITDPDTGQPSLFSWDPAADSAQVLLQMLASTSRPTGASTSAPTHLASAASAAIQLEAERKLAAATTTDQLWPILDDLDDVVRNCPPALQPTLKKLIRKYEASVFEDREFPRLPPDRGAEHQFQIHLEHGSGPIPPSPMHKLSPALVEVLRKMLLELLHDGLISPSHSPFAAPALLVKKSDGKYRLVIDYRKINAITVKDRYALPTAEAVFDRFGGAADGLHSAGTHRPSKWFSKIDLRWAYYQIRMEPSHVPFTAFKTPLGSYVWNVMPMGMSNSPASFQRLMDSIFRDLPFVSMYFDDCIIHSHTPEEHLHHLDTVFQRLQQHSLLARLGKCKFFQESIEFLGHIIDGNGIRTDPAKIAAVQNCPVPRTLKDLQSFLGLCNYYNRFVRNFAQLAQPLTDLLRTADQPAGKKVPPLRWEDCHSHAFEQLKTALCSAPCLSIFNPAARCIVAADASKYAVGGVLQQHDAHGNLHPVAFYSRKLSPAEVNYDTRERECLALKECLRHWKHYLYGAPISISSDHQSLKWLKTQKIDTLSDRLIRWNQFFSLYDFDNIEYLKGTENVPADFCSRPPSATTEVQFSSSDSSAAGPKQHDAHSLAILFDSYQHIQSPLDAPICALVDSVAVTDLLPRLRQAQTHDPVLGPILNRLSSPEYDPAQDPTRPLYSFDNGLLVVREANNRVRAVVPPGPLRLELLRLHHDDKGHPGKDRTLFSLQLNYFWINMARDVARYCASCMLCQATNASSRKPAGFSQPHEIPDAPGASWSTDFIELPETKAGFNCCLVWTDRLTKYCILHPLRMDPAQPLTSLVTAQSFLDRVYPIFGLPLQITSDRGPQFLSQVWHDLWKLLGVQLNLTTAHTPHSNGNAERQNRIINKMLRVMLQGLGNTWDVKIPHLQFEMNSAYVTSIGITPAQALLGFHPLTPMTINVAHGRPQPTSVDFATLHNTYHQIARDALRTAQLRIVNQLDQHRSLKQSYSVGDSAWLSSADISLPGGSHAKLPWLGPFPITAVTPSTVTMELPPLWRHSNTFHVQKVKKHVERPPYLGVTEPPPSPLVRAGKQYFEIDKIVDHRRVGRKQRDGRRKLQYRVHWEGFQPAQDTWEPADHLREDGLEHLIQQYHSTTGRPFEPY